MKTLRIFILSLLATVSSLAANTIYVSPGGTSHTAPYDSPATASTNIQTAVDAALTGDVVILLPGHYVLSAAVEVNQAIEVTAQTNRTAVVDGGGVTRCFSLADVACRLDGLVITNGFADAADGGGVLCAGTNAVLTNCVITDCSANWGGGLYGTTAFHCDIRDNYAAIYGGGVEAATLYACRIFNNSAFSEGGGIDSSTAYNSLIYSNSVTSTNGLGGGGVGYQSVLVNCTVAHNYSAADNGGVEGNAGCIVINSIVVDNTAASSGMNFLGSVAFTNSCCPDLTNGVDGNIVDPPLFADAAMNDYSLSMASPCINAGNDSYVTTLTDLLGNIRMVGTVDMGAYEYQGFVEPDSDGDGMSDADEAIAGTNPTNAASFFAITNWVSGGFTIEWPSFPNRRYRVYRTDSPTNEFLQVGPAINYPQNSYTDSSTSGDQYFYKVEVELK